MVVDSEEAHHADRLFYALADTTRRDLFARATTGDQSVSELARHYSMSFAAVQKHVAVLERAGLVTKQRQGRKQLVTTNIDGLRDARRALDQLEQVWRDRIDRLETIISETEPDEGEHP